MKYVRLLLNLNGQCNQQEDYIILASPYLWPCFGNGIPFYLSKSSLSGGSKTPTPSDQLPHQRKHIKRQLKLFSTKHNIRIRITFTFKRNALHNNLSLFWTDKSYCGGKALSQRTLITKRRMSTVWRWFSTTWSPGGKAPNLMSWSCQCAIP